MVHGNGPTMELRILLLSTSVFAIFVTGFGVVVVVGMLLLSSGMHRNSDPLSLECVMRPVPDSVDLRRCDPKMYSAFDTVTRRMLVWLMLLLETVLRDI